MKTILNVHRRNLFASALTGIGAWLATKSVASAAPTMPDRTKVVYHLCDRDKVNFVLGNIHNHFEGMGGPDKVTIALVVHGPALKAFERGAAGPDVTKRVAGFAQAGLALAACGHTMKAQNITLADLLPGFTTAEQGGVVRIAELQSQGYVYLKP
jgi:intracellular sulfur oxidation DsrE/DsrF family protein